VRGVPPARRAALGDDDGDDAGALLPALEVPSAHVAGFSMGSAIAQELAFRHPDLVRSLVLVSTYARPDALWRSQLNFWRWLPEIAPSERAFFEGFFTWVYTPTRTRTVRWTRSSRRRSPSPTSSPPSLEGRLGAIGCPTARTAAEEDPLAGSAEQVYDELRCPKTLLRFAAAEGAGDHCEMRNRSLLDQRVFDWLDDVLSTPRP
jgi:pimeloyl-ACP methyl ester carboxylesterase